MEIESPVKLQSITYEGGETTTKLTAAAAVKNLSLPHLNFHGRAVTLTLPGLGSDPVVRLSPFSISTPEKYLTSECFLAEMSQHFEHFVSLEMSSNPRACAQALVRRRGHVCFRIAEE